MISAGIRIYALGALALGLVGLIWGDFALVWQPVPSAIPGRTALAYLLATLLVAGGIGANWSRAAAAGTALLSALFGLIVVLLHVPNAVTHPLALGAWSGVAEQLALACAGVLAYVLVTDPSGLRTRAATRAAQLVFGACLIVFGVVHFRYLNETAQMVPRWLPPGQTFWAMATGAAHIAAGVALLTGIGARVAAICLTVMFAAFGLLIHAPLLIADPHSHLNWVMNAMNLALTGSAWVAADSLLRRSGPRVALRDSRNLTARTRGDTRA